jgi:hypothetical protein
VIGRGHVRASPRGIVTLRLRVPGERRGTLELRSAGRIPSRWLARGRPRFVRLGLRSFAGRDEEVVVTIRLSDEHLALLRRMQTMQVVARVTAMDERGRRVRASRLLRLHAPARRTRSPGGAAGPRHP